MVTTGVIIFLVGLVVGLLAFDSFLNHRMNRIEALMWEKSMYDPMLIQKAMMKFWIPLEKFFEQKTQ
jgi:hypothetical protein